MRRSPIGIALVVAGLLAFLWWRSSEYAPAALPPASAPSARQTATPPAPSAATTAERYDLSRDETRGGHTLARHVGRTDAQLFERLRRERHISAASTYADRAVAEQTVARALTASQSRVDAWLSRRGPRPNLALDYHGKSDQPIGRSARRGRTITVTCIDAVVVLRWDRDRTFYVLTTYPEESR